MNCGCSTVAGCCRWISIVLLLGMGVAFSVYHTLEVHKCVRCETSPNEVGEPQRTCFDYKGKDMDWSGLEECSTLTLILTTVGFLFSFFLALFLCCCMACLPSASDGNSKSGVQDAALKIEREKQMARNSAQTVDKNSDRASKRNPIAVSVTAGDSGASVNESMHASPMSEYGPSSPPHRSNSRKPDRSSRPRSTRSSHHPQSPAYSSPLGQHEPVSASRSSILGQLEPLSGDPSKQTLPKAESSQHEPHISQAAPQQQPQGIPVDEWLEGRDHVEDDNLAPIHKVESLMNCIALKEIVSNAPDNPVATDNNSMHADFGDTAATTNTFTTNTLTNNTHNTQNTHTVLGAAGDTYQSTPRGAGDTYVSTPPRTPRADPTAPTSGVGRPPIAISGQVQPVSAQMHGSFDFPTGVNKVSAAGRGDTTGAAATPHGGTMAHPQTPGQAQDAVSCMIGSPKSSAKVAGDRQVLPAAAAAHVDFSPGRDVVDLSPRPSAGLDGGSTVKVSHYDDRTAAIDMPGQDIWTKDHTVDEGSTIDSTKAAYRDNSMLAVHMPKEDILAAHTEGMAQPASGASDASDAAQPREPMHAEAAAEAPERPVYETMHAAHAATERSEVAARTAEDLPAESETKTNIPDAEAEGGVPASAPADVAARRLQVPAQLPGQVPLAESGMHEALAGRHAGLRESAAMHAPLEATAHTLRSQSSESPDHLQGVQSAAASQAAPDAADAGLVQPPPLPHMHAPSQSSQPPAPKQPAEQLSMVNERPTPHGPEYANGKSAASAARQVATGPPAGPPPAAAVAAGDVAEAGVRSRDELVPGNERPAMLSGAAGDREEPPMVWGWSGTDKGWARVPQDVATEWEASTPAACRETSAAEVAAAPPPTHVSPPARRAHWLLMDKFELKEAGAGRGGRGGSPWDTSGRGKRRRGAARLGGKAQAGQSITETQAAGSSGKFSGPGRALKGAIGGRAAQKETGEISESGVIGMPVPPTKGQGSAQTVRPAARQGRSPQAGTQAKPFNWKTLEVPEKVAVQMGGNRSVAVAGRPNEGKGQTGVKDNLQGKGEAHGKDRIQGKGPADSQASTQGKGQVGLADSNGTGQGRSQRGGKSNAENAGVSRGRTNILGWLERGEQAIQDSSPIRQGPLDTLDSDYKLTFEDRYLVAREKGRQQVTPPVSQGVTPPVSQGPESVSPRVGWSTASTALPVGYVTRDANYSHGDRSGATTKSPRAGEGEGDLDMPEQRVNPYFRAEIKSPYAATGNSSAMKVQCLDSNGKVLSSGQLQGEQGEGV